MVYGTGERKGQDRHSRGKQGRQAGRTDRQGRTEARTRRKGMVWSGGTEVDEGWEGYEEDDDKNDIPLQKLYVPKQRPDFSPLYPQKNMCIPI